MSGIGDCFDLWTLFLRGAEPLVGIPLCAAGAALVLSGWRLWRVVAVASLALAGGAVGQFAVQTVTGAGGFHLPWAAGGAVLFAVSGVVLPQHAATIVGGLIGGSVATGVLASFGVVGYGQLVGGLLAFVGAAAWAFANRQRVVVLITSLEGGILLASGIAVMLPEVPLLCGFFRSMVINSPFVVPFFVLVPTVIGVTLQQADANRSSSKAARG
jgi:hypothetical protein